MLIPEEVHRNGVTPHRPGHPDPVTPVFTRYTGRMHLAADDLERLTVQCKSPVTDGKYMLVLSPQTMARKQEDGKSQKDLIHVTKDMIY